MRSRPVFRLVLVFAAVALLLAVVSPLWKSLLTGAVLAAALAPWHDRLSVRLRGRRSLSAALLLVGLVLLVLLPLAWVVSVAVQETLAGIDFVRQALHASGPEALLRHLPGWLADPLRNGLGDLSTRAKDLAAHRGVATAAALGSALSATAQAVVQVVFLLISFYFFLTGGARLVRWLASVSPAPRDTLAIFAQLGEASRSVLSSLVLTALAQSATATVGYVIARVPHPVFFGLLTFLAAFVPSVGTTIVALPVAALILALGHPWWALFLALWAILVVGLIDNVVKPLLMKGGMHLDAAVLFFALIGGLAVFGAVGLIVGPLAVAFFIAVVSGPREDTEALEPADEPAARH